MGRRRRRLHEPHDRQRQAGDQLSRLPLHLSLGRGGAAPPALRPLPVHLPLRPRRAARQRREERRLLRRLARPQVRPDAGGLADGARGDRAHAVPLRPARRLQPLSLRCPGQHPRGEPGVAGSAQARLHADLPAEPLLRRRPRLDESRGRLHLARGGAGGPGAGLRRGGLSPPLVGADGQGDDQLRAEPRQRLSAPAGRPLRRQRHQQLQRREPAQGGRGGDRPGRPQPRGLPGDRLQPVALGDLGPALPRAVPVAGLAVLPFVAGSVERCRGRPARTCRRSTPATARS